MPHKTYSNCDSLQVFGSIDFGKVCSDLDCTSNDCCKLRLLCRSYLKVPVISAPFCRLRRAIILRLENDILTTILAHPTLSSAKIQECLDRKWTRFNVRLTLESLLDAQLIKKRASGDGFKVMRGNVRRIRKSHHQSVPF